MLLVALRYSVVWGGGGGPGENGREISKRGSARRKSVEWGGGEK